MSSHIKIFNTKILVLLIASSYLSGMKNDLDNTIEYAQKFAISDEELMSIYNNINNNTEPPNNTQERIYKYIKKHFKINVQLNEAINNLNATQKITLETLLINLAKKCIREEAPSDKDGFESLYYFYKSINKPNEAAISLLLKIQLFDLDEIYVNKVYLDLGNMFKQKYRSIKYHDPVPYHEAIFYYAKENHWKTMGNFLKQVSKSNKIVGEFRAKTFESKSLEAYERAKSLSKDKK